MAIPEATPTVSVVMTVHDVERYVAEAIESALGQTVPPGEVLVVDDRCTDRTTEIAAGYDGVRVLPNRGEWIAEGRNTGIAAAHGTHIAFLDGDDVWLPTKLERQLELSARQPDAAVFCLIDEFVDGSADRTRTPRLGVPGTLASAFLAPREVLERVGELRATGTSDWIDWWARARKAEVAEAMVGEVLVRRRLHGANTSLGVEHGTSLLGLLRRHLADDAT